MGAAAAQRQAPVYEGVYAIGDPRDREREDGDVALHVGGEGGGAPGQAAGAAAASSEGTMSSFVFGCFAGWVFGALMLFFACAPNASRRFKLGVLTGIALASVSQIMRIADGEDAAAAGAGSGAGGGAGAGAGGGADSGAWSGLNRLAEISFRRR
jgi:hypothetical protein